MYSKTPNIFSYNILGLKCCLSSLDVILRCPRRHFRMTVPIWLHHAVKVYKVPSMQRLQLQLFDNMLCQIVSPLRWKLLYLACDQTILLINPVHMMGYAGSWDYEGIPQSPQKTTHLSTYPTGKQTQTLSQEFMRVANNLKKQVSCTEFLREGWSLFFSGMCGYVWGFCGDCSFPA